LASEQALVTAASGLSKLMAGQPVSGAIKDSTVAQISAAIFFQSHVMSKMIDSPSFISLFNKTIFEQIDSDFGNYVDAKARGSRKSLHHVYEWGRAGDKEARLFKLNRSPSTAIGFTLNYDLKDSKSFVPSTNSSNKHVFIKKASVMELGKTVVISPRSAERLVFDIDGETVFMPKGASVTVTKPGGVATKNSFLAAYKHFFTSQLVNLSIKKSGFQKIFNSSLTKAMSLPNDIKTVKYKFSPNTVANQAEAAAYAGFVGV
jgi:hypothetical protein